MSVFSPFNSGGGTLSEKNVAEIFLLSSDILNAAKLTYQWRNCHGRAYRLYVRSEVEALAKTVEPDPALKAAHEAKMIKQNLSLKRSRLQAVSLELSGIDDRKIALAEEKRQLEEWLLQNDPKASTKYAKDAKSSAKKRQKVK